MPQATPGITNDATLASISWEVNLYVTWDAGKSLPAIRKSSYVSVMTVRSPFSSQTSWKFDAATGYPRWSGIVNSELPAG